MVLYIYFQPTLSFVLYLRGGMVTGRFHRARRAQKGVRRAIEMSVFHRILSAGLWWLCSSQNFDRLLAVTIFRTKTFSQLVQ